jgi:hypothetical protein
MMQAPPPYRVYSNRLELLQDLLVVQSRETIGLSLQICGIMAQISCFQLDFRLARQLTDEN